MTVNSSFRSKRIEALRIDLEHVEGGERHLAADESARLHLGKIAHSAQQPIGDARSAARALRDPVRAIGLEIQLQDRGTANHDLRQFRGRIEFQTLHDAEAISQRRGEKPRSGRGANQGEGRQIELDRPRPGALADHQVELRVLHRRIQNFLDHRAQAMNLIHEQHVARLEVRQQSGQIARALQHGTRGLPQVDLEFVGDDVCERGLAEARRTEDEHVIQGFAAHARRLHEDAHLGLHVGLTHVVGEALRPNGSIDDFVVPPTRAGNDPILFDSHARSQAFAADFRARRMISVVDSPGSSAAFNRRVTSGGL